MSAQRAMPGRTRGWRWWEATPLVATFVFCFPALFGEQLTADAAHYAAIACKGVWEGHWWTLYVSAEPYFNKPPLAFWLHMPFIAAFGPEQWALRLPDLMALLVTILAVQLIGRRLGGAHVGMWGALLLGCTRWFTFLADSLRLDYIHNAFMFWGVWLVVAAAFAPVGRGGRAGSESEARELLLTLDDDRRRARRLVLLSGVFIGLALMVKPLWALGAYGVLTIWLALEPANRAEGGSAPHLEGVHRARVRPVTLVRHMPLGALISLAIAAPWHLSMVMLHGRAFVDQYIFRQALDRAITDRFGSEPWWWYLDYLVVNVWPLLLLPLAGLVLWVTVGRWSGRRDGEGRGRRPVAGALLFGLVWTIAWLVILSLGEDKRRYYLLHIFPAMCMVSAAMLGWIPVWRSRAWWRRWAGAALVVMTGGIVFIGTRPELFEPGRSRTIVGEYRHALRTLRGEAPPRRGPWARAWEFVRTVDEPIYVGAAYYTNVAGIYIRTRRWPIGVGWAAGPWPAIPPGALALYDTRFGVPPQDEPVLFRAGYQHEGSRYLLLITRRSKSVVPVSPATLMEQDATEEAGTDRSAGSAERDRPDDVDNLDR